MTFKYKIQDYQTRAVNAVVDCFNGQAPVKDMQGGTRLIFRNPDFTLSKAQILDNIQQVQRAQDLPQSKQLADQTADTINLDVEMETGTGKTYCYIKTIFEMNKKFGWTKFIIMVPSIAIREGVYQSLQDMSDHFQQTYHKPADSFIYSSKNILRLKDFTESNAINIMVINIQAFNATGKDNRRIYEELEDFESRRPIDEIADNQPILILDEPQKMGTKTQEALEKFNPLFILRYSATHSAEHNKVHRLDALDAYEQKLVKKINVSGIEVKNLSGASGYLYLQAIDISKHAPVARMEIEVNYAKGPKREFRKLKKGSNLYEISKELEQYKDFIVAEIDANTQSIKFTNGHTLEVGEYVGDETDKTLRQLQIREAVRVHLETEQRLFHKGIKVLSLFFIDKVAKYRVYTDTGEENGEYATMFEEEYKNAVAELKTDMFKQDAYKDYLERDAVRDIHNGYFSMDKKSKRMKDSTIKRGTLEADDVDAYDLILKNKKQLLSFDEPTRFIFSHSALREGWDNPNVFVICTLKKSNNDIPRRQEVGRGMRIALNDRFERQDDPETVHDTNILTVVASESYTDFVTALQKSISESLSARPAKADKDYFLGKFMDVGGRKVLVTPEMANAIEFYLIQNQYVDLSRKIVKKYYDAVKAGTLAELDDELQPYSTQIFGLIDSVYSDAKLPKPDNARRVKNNPLNKDRFNGEAFQELWKRINHTATYTLNFKGKTLIKDCIKRLNDDNFNVASLSYSMQRGEQTDDGFNDPKKTRVKDTFVPLSLVAKYDIIGKIAKETELSRKTIGAILSGIKENKFIQFQTNPERFIAEVIREIRAYRREIFFNKLCYDTISNAYNIDIFHNALYKEDGDNTKPLENHIYRYLASDSGVERDFAKELDGETDVLVYAKLPSAFTIPTPIGNYNPDWAIAFKEGSVNHVYFVAETKKSDNPKDLRGDEKDKIKYAKKFFDAINEKNAPKGVKYDVVTNIDSLLKIAGKKPTPTHTKNT